MPQAGDSWRSSNHGLKGSPHLSQGRPGVYLRSPNIQGYISATGKPHSHSLMSLSEVYSGRTEWTPTSPSPFNTTFKTTWHLWEWQRSAPRDVATPTPLHLTQLTWPVQKPSGSCRMIVNYRKLTTTTTLAEAILRLQQISTAPGSK